MNTARIIREVVNWALAMCGVLALLLVAVALLEDNNNESIGYRS